MPDQFADLVERNAETGFRQVIFPELAAIVKENSSDEQIQIQLRIKRRDLGRDPHHLSGVLDQSAAARVMISARTGRVTKARAVLRDERGTECVKPRITNRRRRRDNKFPIRRVPGAQLGRALKEVALFLRRQLPRRPAAGVETVLLMLIKFAGDFNEIPALQRVAGLVIGMIAPDPQGHAIARVSEGEFTIRFLLASQFCSDGLELNMNACFHRAVGDRLANLLQSRQFKHDLRFASSGAEANDLTLSPRSRSLRSGLEKLRTPGKPPRDHIR